jgi:predicted transcriptional regulator of viral defense system
MDADRFFALYPVFTAAEFGESVGLEGRPRDALLARQRKRGRLIQVRRGLYWVVPEGETPEACAVDLWVCAGLMTEDAVLGYHTALAWHTGNASGPPEVHYLTAHAVRQTRFRGWRFRGIPFPRALVRSAREFEAVDWIERDAETVRVTSRERTLVDVLDRPDLGTDWLQIWSALAALDGLDVDLAIDYALTLGNATSIAKLGWFLEVHAERLGVAPGQLEPLRARRPRQPHYLRRCDIGAARMIGPWNLVVPRALAEMTVSGWR